jgi:hypothetical protein
MRAPSAAAVVLLLSSCLPFRLWRRERHRGPALDRKAVLTKEKPTSLIAADGSRCLVGEDRFADIRVGDRVWCVWSVKDGQKTAYTWGDGDAPPGERRKPGSSSSGGVHVFGWP